MSAGKVELRGECPEETVAMIDAIAMARALTRTQLVNEILGQWAVQQRHAAIVACRVLRINPLDSAAVGM